MIRALHGAFGSAADWDDLRSLVRGREVAADDLWGPEHDLPLREWGAWFSASAAATDTEPLLLGYSMGGRLGLHALLASPDTWRGAVIVSAHPGLPSDADRCARRALDDEWLARLDSAEWPEFWRAWAAQPVLRAARDRPVPVHRAAARRGLEAWSLSEQEDLRPLLDRIHCPVLWITGERDAGFTALAASAVVSMPRAKHVIVEGAGHRVPWDAPEAFARLVSRFAGTLAGPAR